MGKAKWVRVLGLLLGVVIAILVVPSIVLATGDVNEAQCPAETEASPGYRAYLPDCRAYELVTPPYKAGGVVLDEPGAVSASGLRVIVGAGGAFSGTGNFWYDPARSPNAATYQLVRGADGWGSSALTPPASEYSHSVLMAASSGNFEATLWGAEKTGLPYHEDIYLRTGPEASEFNLIGPGTPRNEKGEQILANGKLGLKEELNLVGASSDLSHSLFKIDSSSRLGHSDLWEGDTTESNKESLYEYVHTGTEDSEPVLVGVKNNGGLKGHPINGEAELISSCGTELGSGNTGSVYNAVSSSGEIVYFTARACAGSPEVDELYARIGGEHTVAISEPVLPGGAAGECASSEPCHGAKEQAAVFEGASEDGRRVFFLSEQPLVNGAPAEGVKLYEERLEGTSVVRVVDVSNQGIAAGIDPEVQGVARISENGERIYFVAKGKLVGGDKVAGREPEAAEPEQGADNLYVYEPEPGSPGVFHTVFVATLLRPSEEATLTTAEAEEREAIETQAKKTFTFEFERAETEVIQKFIKGEIELEQALELLKEEEAAARERERAFIRNTVGTLGPTGTLPEDRSVWQAEDTRPVQTTPGGGVLAFLSSAELTPQDTSSVPQLFTYDAGDQSLTRVSIGQAGPASGNIDTFRDAPRIPEPSFNSVDRPTAAATGLALSEDGSRIFIASAADLVPQVEDKATNVYEYSGGGVYLISGGGDASSVNGTPTVTLLGTDPSGRDVFFLSETRLVPQYGDTQVALYDAREEGGFPAPALEPGCSGEACRGPSGAAPAYQMPGSASQTSGGNVSPPASVRPEAVGPRTPTRSQRLAKALRTCRAKRARKRRAACEARVRRRYGKTSAASKVKSARTTRAKREAGR
jgi:hypothetical protein